MEYVLLWGLLIHPLNQPAASSSQPGTAALQASQTAFPWLHLQGNATKGSEERRGTSSRLSDSGPEGPGW